MRSLGDFRQMMERLVVDEQADTVQGALPREPALEPRTAAIRELLRLCLEHLDPPTKRG